MPFVPIPQQMQGQQQEEESYNAPPFIRQETRADVMKEVRPEDTVEFLFHKLMGERFVNGRWERLAHANHLALTEVGAWDIACLLLGISNKNITYSNLTDKEIKWRVLRISETAQDMMLANWTEYGIRSATQLEFVNELVVSTSLATLKQAKDAGMRNAVMRTQTEIHSTMQQQAMPSAGFLSKLFSFRNR